VKYSAKSIKLAGTIRILHTASADYRAEQSFDEYIGL